MRNDRNPATEADSWVPAGSCDCHLHLFGPADRYPYGSERSYTPEEATLHAYLQTARELGFGRLVLVQPSVYGTDNTRHLDALRLLGEKARLVIVTGSDIGAAEIERLHELGVRGVRWNTLFEGGPPPDEMEAVAAKVQARGWHFQLLLDGNTLPGLSDRLRALELPLVFDHVGHFSDLERAEEGFETLLELVREDLAWVKLSGPYRLSERCYPFEDVKPLIQELVKTAPQRLVWGSDWPHPEPKQEVPSFEKLVGLLHDWISDSTVRRQILVTNPEKLYGFR